MSDESVRLALRVHDEVVILTTVPLVSLLTIQQCNGSDVFGSDICTCRPYLIFGIEEAVKEAQQGGSGIVIYFRKEGRALGEVTKVKSLSLERGSTELHPLICRPTSIPLPRSFAYSILSGYQSPTTSSSHPHIPLTFHCPTNGILIR